MLTSFQKKMIRSVITLLWLGAIRGSVAPTGELGYTLEKYDRSPGIYFERAGQVKLYNTEWKVVVYVDLKGTDTQSDEIENYMTHINKLCTEIAVQNWTDCYHFPEIARDKLMQIKKTEGLIMDITDHPSEPTRRKRGVFNFVGEISKILFGTMDDEDAGYYNEQIERFEENSDDITKLLKQQLYVVKSSLRSVNNTLTDIEYNQEEVKKGLQEINDYIKSTTGETREKINMVAAEILVESHIARAGEAIATLQRNLDILLQRINNARKGIFEPRVVAPKLIMDALIKSMPSFPKDTISPFSLSKNSINLVYRICDVHVYLEKNVLGHVITLPLIGRGMFKAYKMIPIPMFLENGKFAYINTQESNLCFEQTSQYYFGISNTEFENCKKVDNQTKICTQKHPLLSSHLHESCAVKLLQQEVEIPKNCDTRLAQVKNTIWTQLDNNEWLYFAPVAKRVTVLCNDRDPLDVTVTGVGKITLHERCKGYSAFAHLQSSLIIKAKALNQEDRISRVRLDWDCLEN
jgi:hypothetical protein